MTAGTSARWAVDIVINNFNYAEYVADAIDSALAQTHPGVRVIVVDDGSTDDSRERIAAYGDRVDAVFKPNGGQASAFNAALERCHGDIVIFLDSDDVLEPDAAARLVRAFAEDPRVVKVQARMRVIDAGGVPTGVTKPPPHLPLPTGDLRHAELAYPFDIVWLPTSANAFRRDALRTILPIPEAEYGACGADWYLNHLTALIGRVVSLDDVTARYRIHGRNHYELQTASIDVPHLHETIVFAAATTRALTELADRLGRRRPARILSISDLANRVVSLRLEPQSHPVPTDTRASLMVDAIRAIRRRDDVSGALHVLYLGWFMCALGLPRPAMRRIAEIFLFPDRRALLMNDLIRRLHRDAAPAPSVRRA